MRNQSKGFTLLELLITVMIIGILGALVAIPFINPPGKTEASAYEGAERFIATNSLAIKRKTCAHDSDGDGQASCTLVTKEDEKIFLSCPVGIFNKAMGAESCKETAGLATMQINSRRVN